jgi:hypothetical protein
MVNELGWLTSAAPSGGYGEHSVEMMRIIQLRRGIAALMEVDHQSGANSGTSEDTSSAFASRQEPGSSAPQTYPPTPPTLHHRMLQIQEVLSQMDDLVSTGASEEETQNKIKDLRARISLLMDSNNGSIEETSLRPGGSGRTQVPGGLSFPEPVHFVSTRQGADSPQLTRGGTTVNASTGLRVAGGGEGSSTGGRGDGNPAAEIQNPPPPYQAVVGTSEDGRSVQAAASGP